MPAQSPETRRGMRDKLPQLLDRRATPKSWLKLTARNPATSMPLLAADVAETPAEIEARKRADGFRRREALRSWMAENKLRTSELSKVPGMPSASAVSNFLNAYSDTLNAATYEALHKAFGVSINRLLGLDTTVDQLMMEINVGYIRGEIAADIWREQFFWPEERWIRMPIARNRVDYGESYFLQVASEEMNEVYKVGTVVELVSLGKFTGDLSPGNRVVLLRSNTDGLVEVSCRELVAYGDGVVKAITRSTNPQFQKRPLPLKWPIEPGAVVKTVSGDWIEVRAVVVRIILDEIGGGAAEPAVA